MGLKGEPMWGGKEQGAAEPRFACCVGKAMEQCLNQCSQEWFLKGFFSSST